MTREPFDDDFRLVSAMLHRDHDERRGELLGAIARGDHLRFEPARAAGPRKWLKRGVLALAACSAAALAAWFVLVTGSSTPAFALDGIHERLLKIRSLHVTGRMYQTIIGDGPPRREEFPTEFYVERPARSWNTWYGFSPDQVKSGFNVCDGTRQLWVSHADKLATLTNVPQLAIELRVEGSLQNYWTRQIVGDETDGYKLIGKERINSVQALQYELVQTTRLGKTRHVVWVNAQTGLPVRSAWYDIDANGKEQLDHIYDRIETNVPARPEMFSFEVPEGYQFEQSDEPDGDPFRGVEGSAGADRLAARFVLAIDERAALACWLHEKRGPDGPARRGWVADVLRMEFSGADAKRPCEWHFLSQQQDRERLWTWSLVLPRDHEFLKLGEALDIVYEGRNGTVTMSNGPLRFDDERLARILERLQTEAFSAPPVDEVPFTLEGLRKKVAEVLAGTAEPEK